jgi:hypothetical protein
MHMTRVFAPGSAPLAVATATEADRQLVESLLRDVPAPSSTVPDVTVFSLIREDADGSAWTLDAGRVDNLSVPTLDGALNLLVSEISFATLESEPEHLHLHAALAVKDGRAAILAAQHNTGKTTTVANLVARGWSFVTDEVVRLSPQTEELTGFRKPISIKPGGRAFLDHLAPWMIPAVDNGTETFRFAPIGASGADVVDGGSPHLVVLLRRDPFAPPVVRPETRRLHPADAVVLLMQETFDAERFGATVVRLAELAATSHCFELTVGTPEATVNEIEALAQLDPPEPVDVTVLPPSDAYSSGVVSVMLGDQVVVHDTDSGRILALDPGGTRVWQQLSSRGEDDAIDIDGPVVDQFVAQLRALGVLASTR